MSKFPAGAIPAVAENIWIKHNMGVALKKELSRPLSREIPGEEMTKNSPLRMTKFPVGVWRIVVENTRINNMGVAEKRDCPAPFPKKLPLTQIPYWGCQYSLRVQFHKNLFSQNYENIRLNSPIPTPTPYRNKCNSPLPFSRKSSMTLLLRDISLSSSKYFDICVYSAFCFLSQEKYWIHKE